MKKYMPILILILMSNCGKSQRYYSGFVYDQTSKKPINRVLIKENFSSSFKYTYTNDKGYFKINNNSESIADLIFVCNGYKTDTIVTVWSQRGENLKYRFVRKESDTLYMQKIK